MIFLQFPDFRKPTERWCELVAVSCGIYAQVERATVREKVKVTTLTEILVSLVAAPASGETGASVASVITSLCDC